MNTKKDVKTRAESRYKNYSTTQLFVLIDKLERKTIELASDIKGKQGYPAFEKICRLQSELDAAYLVLAMYQEWHRDHSYTVTAGPMLKDRGYGATAQFNPKTPPTIHSVKKG